MRTICRDTARRQNDLFLVADLTRCLKAFSFTKLQILNLMNCCSLELALQTMREETDTHWLEP